MSNQDSPDEINPLEDQPLTMLSLFSKRVPKPDIKIDIKTYVKIYQQLCCRICLSIVKNPVFLQCSHRFCKECIEKCIRLTDKKKSCPNCRGKLSTKRDLHDDFSTASLCKFAFGDMTDFRLKIDQMQKSYAEKLKNTKSIPKTKSINRSVSKRKNLSSDQGQYQAQPQPQPQPQPQCSETEVKNIRLHRQTQQNKVNQLTNSNFSLQQNSIQSQSVPRTSRGRGRGTANKAQKQKKFSKQQKKVQKMKAKQEQKREKQSNLALKQAQQGKKLQLLIQSSNIKINNKNQRKNSRKKESQIILINSSEQQDILSPAPILSDPQEVCQAKQILKKQLGQNYKWKMLHFIADCCCVQVRLKLCKTLSVHFNQKINDNLIRVNLGLRVQVIIGYIQHLWDFQQGSIQVSILAEADKKGQLKPYSDANLEVCNPQMNLLQINQKYWRVLKGIVMYDKDQVKQPIEVKSALKDSSAGFTRTFYVTAKSLY